MSQPTIRADTSPVDAIWFAVLGGQFRVRLTEDNGPGLRSGEVLDEQGRVIGSASDFIYRGAGFCICTAPYHGYAALDQIALVE